MDKRLYKKLWGDSFNGYPHTRSNFVLKYLLRVENDPC